MLLSCVPLRSVQDLRGLRDLVEVVEEQRLELEQERGEVARLKKRVSDMSLHKKQWVADIQDVDKLKKEVGSAVNLC